MKSTWIHELFTDILNVESTIPPNTPHKMYTITYPPHSPASMYTITYCFSKIAAYVGKMTKGCSPLGDSVTAGMECMEGSAMYLKSTGTSLHTHTHTHHRITSATSSFSCPTSVLRQQDLTHPVTELRSCVKVKVAVLGSLSLTVFMVSVDVIRTQELCES